MKRRVPAAVLIAMLLLAAMPLLSHHAFNQTFSNGKRLFLGGSAPGADGNTNSEQ